jgi:urease accessory protein
MRRDAAAARGARPFVFTDLRRGTGVDRVVDFITRAALLDEPA